MEEGKYQVDNTGPVQGQNIGDHLQVTQYFYGSGSTPSSAQRAPSPVPTDLNRQRMLKRVRSIWITGVLEQSLHGAALIALDLQGKPDTLANPWRLLVQEVDQSAQALSSGTRITEVYDKSEGALLLLGEPGSGKTTLLLELTRDLLDRAETNTDDGIPVIFNLSSWAKKRPPLADWLVEELSIRYDVPRRLGLSWVSNDRLLLLLDGLDEVSPTARKECIQAINRYREAHPLVPVVVCSRNTEYLNQHMQLRLHTAVVIQPLTQVQIDEYLVSAGAQVEALHVALHTDLDLQELATTPLMLSVLTLAYQGTPLDEITALDSLKTRQRQVFDAYVQRMLKRRSAETHYTPQQITQWLSWLARRMKQQGQTVLYLERMQPNWLADRRLHLFYRWFVVLLVALISGVLFTSGYILFVLVPLVVVGYYVGGAKGPPALVMMLISNPLLWFTTGPDTLLVSGFALTPWIMGGVYLISTSHNRSVTKIQPVEVFVWSWRGIRRSFVVRLGVLWTIGIYIILAGMPSVGLIVLLIGSLVIALLNGVSAETLEKHALVKPNQGIWRSARNSAFSWLVSELVAMLAIGPLFSLLILSAITDGQRLLPISILVGLCAGGEIGLAIGWVFGLLNGGFACIQHIALRLLLWLSKCAPWNYPRFLDDAAERVLLRKVGGGYIFIHRLLLEYFASIETSFPEEVLAVSAISDPPPAVSSAPKTNIAQGEEKAFRPVPSRITGFIKGNDIAALFGVLILLLALVSVVQQHRLNPYNAQSTTAQLEANATAQLEANATAEALANASPVAYPPKNTSPVFDDPLQDNSKGNNWEVDSPGNGNCKFINQAYDINTNQLEWCSAGSTDFTNFIYEVQMKIIKGDGGGIEFRINPRVDLSQFYYFAINQDGSYSVDVFTTDGNDVMLTQGFSTAIHQGLNQINLVAAVVHGAIIELYVNHKRVAVVGSSTYTHGLIGVIVTGLYNQTEVIFQNAKVWKL